MENEIMPSVAQTEEESTDLDTVEEQVDSVETTEKPDSVEAPEVPEESEEVIALRAELEKAKQEKENQRIRAEKAEKEARKPKLQPKVDGLTSKDTIAIINAKVNEEDVDDVVRYAKFEGISVSEALKTSIVRTLLAEKEEHRATAQATNTSRSRSASRTLSGATLVDKANKGELPDADEDIEKLAAARYGK